MHHFKERRLRSPNIFGTAKRANSGRNEPDIGWPETENSGTLAIVVPKTASSIPSIIYGLCNIACQYH